MPAYECQTCAHRHLMPHQHPCAMCSRRYSLRWEPVQATLIATVQPSQGVLR